MKKSICRAIVSMLVLTLVGAGLCFWLYKAEGYDEKAEGFVIEKESQRAEEERSQKDFCEDVQMEEGNQEVAMIFAGDIYLSNYVLEQYTREGIGGSVSEKLLLEMQQGLLMWVQESIKLRQPSPFLRKLDRRLLDFWGPLGSFQWQSGILKTNSQECCVPMIVERFVKPFVRRNSNVTF